MVLVMLLQVEIVVGQTAGARILKFRVEAKA